MDISSEDLFTWLRYAEEATRVAAKYLLACAKESKIVVTKAQGKDIKLEADRESESQIIRFLREKTNFVVLSEESGGGGANEANSVLRWIIDPLDGSLNFYRRIPFCCISIALWKGQEPLLGVIYDFNRDEMFSGLAAGGAWLNAKPVRLSDVRAKSQALLCAGFPIGSDFSSAALVEIVCEIQAYKKIRWLGSAALSLAYVACGRADAYQEDNIAIWDVAAGLAIVAGAGGRVSFLPAQRRHRLFVRAANPFVFEQMSAINSTAR